MASTALPRVVIGGEKGAAGVDEAAAHRQGVDRRADAVAGGSCSGAQRTPGRAVPACHVIGAHAAARGIVRKRELPAGVYGAAIDGNGAHAAVDPVAGADVVIAQQRPGAAVPARDAVGVEHAAVAVGHLGEVPAHVEVVGIVDGKRAHGVVGAAADGMPGSAVPAREIVAEQVAGDLEVPADVDLALTVDGQA